MHYHCEIILPPGTEDIRAAVDSVMAPFDENGEDNRDSFWDWWVIGGRWAGNKMLAGFDADRVQEFRDWLKSEGVTVSGLQCGKPQLEPAGQREKVDAKWSEMFCEGGVIVACPIFQHSNDPYADGGEGVIEGDICNLSECREAKCSRIIFAAPSWDGEKRGGPLEAVFMLTDSQWNGCNHMPVDWDGSIVSAETAFREHLRNYAEGYREVCEPHDDSIAVTVDYHS